MVGDRSELVLIGLLVCSSPVLPILGSHAPDWAELERNKETKHKLAAVTRTVCCSRLYRTVDDQCSLSMV
eukprot:9035134-Pyramimonas_sp.AAC.1